MHFLIERSPSVRSRPRAISFLLLSLLSVLAALSDSQAEGILTGPRIASIRGIDPGSLLVGELNCTACHLAEGAVRDQVIPRPSPRLGPPGMPLTPQGLRAFLSDPQTEKPGTTMPDLLHGVADREGTIDALVHFLYANQANPADPPVGADDFLIEQGRALYHQVGCVGCHAPGEPPRMAVSLEGDNAPEAGSADELLSRLQQSSVPLGNLARKTTVSALAGFLMDPLKSRPGGRMPSFNLSKPEATAIAVYLLRQQAGLSDPTRPPTRVAGLQYHYFEQSFSSAVQMDDARPDSTGVVPRFQTTPRKRDQNMGFRFTGSISLPTAGEYTFFTHSDDGSILWINGTLVVNNDGTHGGTERDGKIRLPAGDHAIRVTYFNSGGPHEFRVSYEGPGIKKQEIPADVLTHYGRPMVPLDDGPFTVDPAKVLRGRSAFASLGCAACHQVGEHATEPVRVQPLHHLNPAAPGGCMNQPLAGRPKYALSADQHTAIARTLKTGFSSVVGDGQKVLHSMAAFNCFACHSRDGIGGPDPGRARYFNTVGELDLGDEGRFPPHLGGVGAKLRPEWLRKVLLGNDNKVRPYMATRMPHFGEPNVGHLPQLFVRTDLKSELPEDLSMTDAKYGRKLVGTGGLSCIACHTYGEYPSLGIPALDLTHMTGRLRQDWFHRYLLDPASLRPGTRMPSFWPEGVAANQEILDGNPDRQIQSIWAFLSLGGKTLPPGLVQGTREIVASEEAVIYRHFISGAGTRAIGVGYPRKTNLAFDANDVRLALIWQGAFIDAAKHRSGRGAGFEGPLGYNVIAMTPGAPFAILPDPEAPWPAATGREAGYRMGGYRLDPQRRPAFLYSFGTIEIEDYPVDLEGELDGTLQRTLSLTAPEEVKNLWFRAWIGTQVERKEDGGFLVDNLLTLKFSGADDAILRRKGERVEILVPVRFNDGKARFVEELIW